MLRPSRQASSILPDHGAPSQSSCSVGYGNSGYGNGAYGSTGYGNSAYGTGYDNNSSRKSFSSPLSSKRRPSYSSNSDFLPSALRNSASWLALGLGFFILLSGYYQSKFQWVMRELNADSLDEAVQKYRMLYNERSSRKRLSSDMDERYSILERLNSKLHKEKEDLRSSYEKKIMKEFTNRRQEEDRLVAREEAFKSQIKILQDASSKEAQRSVADRFGSDGPHFVEFTFVLPSDHNETEHHFIVETAPSSLMPHAVQLFLEQVAHKLWDDSWFYINGPHVLQAGPMLEEDDTIEEDTFEEDRKRALEPFVDAGLDKLPFPEYSNQFQHEKWTLGFTGRPGGPDWYINKQNNTVMHGPGGQYHHDIEEQADPCFAKVIEGFELIEQIFKESTIEEGDDWEYFFWDPVYIVKATIIDKPHHIDAASDGNSSHHQTKHHHIDYHKFPKVDQGKA